MGLLLNTTVLRPWVGHDRLVRSKRFFEDSFGSCKPQRYYVPISLYCSRYYCNSVIWREEIMVCGVVSLTIPNGFYKPTKIIFMHNTITFLHNKLKTLIV